MGLSEDSRICCIGQVVFRVKGIVAIEAEVGAGDEEVVLLLTMSCGC